MVLVQKGRHLEKKKFSLYLLLCVMINSKWIRYFYVRNKTKITKRIWKIFNPWYGKIFKKLIQNPEAIKKLMNLNTYKNKSFYMTNTHT